MPNFRRVRVPGGTWLFTVNLLERKQRLLTERMVNLRLAIARTKRAHPFRVEALVVLPDHLHAVLTLPPGDSNFSTRWRLIKTGFAKSLPNTERLSSVREAKGERGIWQRRFWEHYIRDEHDLIQHVRYCYYNPVKHGHVTRMSDWPHSTFHRDVRPGRFEQDFDIEDIMDATFGESEGSGGV